MVRTQVLMMLNRLFKAPVHPFNLQKKEGKSYALWQYEKGGETLKFFQKKYTQNMMLKNKTVVDIGCGPAGKSLYFASHGAKKVYGVDMLEQYKKESMKLAEKLGVKDRFEFVSCDSTRLPFPDGFADTIILNNTMEHLAEPEKSLMEMERILSKNGRIYINFPPYYHPSGAHLTDAVFIPWVHLLFSDKVLIEAYKKLVSGLPDGESRIKFRISKRDDGTEYFSYINKMTVKRFRQIVKELDMKPVYYEEVPLRPYLLLLARIPVIKEMFIRTVVCVFEKKNER